MSMPWKVDGAKAHGPGIYDMKAGSFFAFHSVREILRDYNLRMIQERRRPVVGRAMPVTAGV